MAEHNIEAQFKHRLGVLSIAFCVWFCVIIWALCSLRWSRGKQLLKLEVDQNLVGEVEVRRGTIYDRKGHELALSLSLPRKQSSIVGMGWEVSDQIIRFYPGEQLAAQVIGFPSPNDSVISEEFRRASEDSERLPQAEDEEQRNDEALGGQNLSEEVRGLGIELAADKELRGRPGARILGDGIHTSNAVWARYPRRGNDVVLALDSYIQQLAEDELETAVSESDAEGGGVVVEVPQTGHLLAIANRPTFNLNSLPAADSCALVNHPFADAFEPGSLFKIVTIGAALEAGRVNATGPITCDLPDEIARSILQDQLHRTRKLEDMLRDREDTCIASLAFHLEPSSYLKYLRAFGFGSRTGIELPDSPGTIPALNTPTQVAALTLGQNIGVTPLQITVLMSSIANDGIKVRPRLIIGKGLDAIFSPEEQPENTTIRLMSSSTAKRLRDLLVGISPDPRQRDGDRLVGIGGTGWRIDATRGINDPDDYVSYFSGFGPVGDPRLAVTLILDSPRRNASQVSAVHFWRILSRSLQLMNDSIQIRDLEPSDLELFDDVPLPKLAENVEPVGYVLIGNQEQLVGSNGALMEDKGAGTNVMPLITGITNTQSIAIRKARVRQYTRLIRDLKCVDPRRIHTIKEVDLSDSGEVSVVVSDELEDVRILLGVSGFRQKFGLFMKFIDEWQERNPGLKSVDLRSDGQVILMPKETSR